VNKLVLQGVPFRDAYKQVGADIEQQQFVHSTQIAHTHEGSIGNLHNEAIAANMHKIVARFNFSKVDSALQQLLQ